MLEIGNIIKYDNEEFELINIDRYDSGRRRYHLKCLKCDNITTTTKENLLKYISDKKKCNKCSKNTFKLSDDGTYWIGITRSGYKFYFNGNNSKYIMKFTWKKTKSGYFQNKNGELLHRVVMGVTDRNIIINHIGGNRSDNRIECLSISDYVDNSKEKKPKKTNRSGIVGLKKTRNGKYVGNIKINGILICSKYKVREEALIDLLIMQRHYGFRHNMDLYNLLDNVSEERINEVIDNCERQLNKKRTDKIVSSNKFRLSHDKTFYWVYDNKNNKFKISIESKNLVKQGRWYVAIDKNRKKTYVQGTVIIDGKRKTVKLHRYIMNIIEDKYKLYLIDHKNGDELDNRLENLCITTPLGNGHQICNDTIQVINNKYSTSYRIQRTIYGKKFNKIFKTKKEAKKYILEIKEYIKNNQPHWKNKEELDEYLNNK